MRVGSFTCTLQLHRVGAVLPTIELRSVSIAVGEPGPAGRSRVTACSRLSKEIPAGRAGLAGDIGSRWWM